MNNIIQSTNFSVIKIQLNLSGRLDRVMNNRKYLIDIVPDFHTHIIDFLGRVTQVLNLNLSPHSLQIEDDGFILPHKMGIRCLNLEKIYVISDDHIQKPKIKKKKQSIQQSLSSQSLSPQSSSSSSSQSSVKKVIKKKILKPKHRSPSSSSSSSSLQIAPKSKKQIIEKKRNYKQNTQRQIQQKNTQRQIQPQKKIANKPIIATKNSKQTIKNKPKSTPINKKKHSSSQQSSQQLSSESILKLQLPKSQHKQVGKNVQNIKLKKVPISVRAKQHNPQNRLQRPKLAQKKIITEQIPWIPITKQIFSQYSKNNPIQCILKQNNRIRFKVIELDMQKFVPITSGWIQGSVQQMIKNNDDWQIKLVNIFKQDSKQRQRQMQVGLVNMQQLQIFKQSLIQDQKHILNTNTADLNNIQETPKQQHKKQIIQKQPNQQKQKVQSVEDVVCGQIHYYFSHKNYQKDLFMQMHANKHPQKYLNLRIMLNFPKIKKYIRDEDKLLEYLLTDPKLAQRNYEIDKDKKLIRCKKYRDYHLNNPAQQQNQQAQKQTYKDKQVMIEQQ